jgi:hypothetical protein
MKLKELLKVIESRITLEIAGVKEKYDSKLDVKKDQMDYIVKSIKTDNNGILIVLEESSKVETLEDLNYSFESGM